MKQIAYFLVCLVPANDLFAQMRTGNNFETPEQQISFARENKPHSYYVRPGESQIRKQRINESTDAGF